MEFGPWSKEVDKVEIPCELGRCSLYLVMKDIDELESIRK